MIPLKHDQYYHVYNRANGFEKIFVEEENYRFFLEKYQLYISPYVDTYCYCLMPNHFHFLVSIKSENEILNVLAREEKTLPKFKTLEEFSRKHDPARFEYLEKLISKQFSNFFSCYTQAFNKQQKRMGSLFMKNFKRKVITDSDYLRNVVQYIHLNPVAADICSQPNQWKHSTYSKILNGETTFVKTKEVIRWFDNRLNFEFNHQKYVQIQDILEYD